MIPPVERCEAVWPPPFSIRKSARAKRISLRIDPERGLEIVLPEKTPEKWGLRFLNEHRAWIEKHAHHLKWQLQASEFVRYALPKQLTLPLFKQSWCIDYCPTQSARTVNLAVSGDRLVFFGRFHHFKPCIPLMTDWLKNQAKKMLPNLLHTVSKECRLSYRTVGIRGQKTLWGSCNDRKDIQLNYKLIFLPKDLVRYVIIHELCHTVRMDHSKLFWHLVEKHIPNYKIYIAQLKQSNQWIPRWLT